MMSLQSSHCPINTLLFALSYHTSRVGSVNCVLVFPYEAIVLDPLETVYTSVRGSHGLAFSPALALSVAHSSDFPILLVGSL